MKKTASSGDPSAALMRDVAELAGVATSTVSRALANPGRVNEKTRKKIAAAAEKLGYTPNAAARNLRVGKSNIVMIVLPGPLHYGASQIVPEVLQAIDAELVKKGFNLLIANLDRLETTERHILDLAFDGTVRGAIVLSSQLPSVGNRSLKDAGIPIVSLLHDLSSLGVPSVVTNDRQIMRDVTSRLLEHGHKRLFYVAGPKGNYHEVERYAGILEAFAVHGIADEQLSATPGERLYEEGFSIGLDAADIFLGMQERPTAVLCCSDDAAISFMSKVRRAGLRVPADVSIIGFDGAAVGAFCDPPLSTVQQPGGEMGAKAAELLLAQLDMVDVDQRTVIDSIIVERESM